MDKKVGVMCMDTKDRWVDIKGDFGGHQVWFRSLMGTEAISQHSVFKVNIDSDSWTLPLKRIWGQTISIQIHSGGQVVKNFHGVVTAMRLLGRVGRHVSYEIQLHSSSWLLTCSTQSRIFQEQTLSGILENILQPWPEIQYRLELRRSYPLQAYCVQYQESDYNFFARLLQKNGMHFFFEHTEQQHVMVIGDGVHVHRVLSDMPTISWVEQVFEHGVAQHGVHEWVTAVQAQPQWCILRDFNFEKPWSNLEVSQKNDSTDFSFSFNRQFFYSNYPGGYQQTEEGDFLAQIKTEIWQQQQEVGKGVANVISITPGRLFHLNGHPCVEKNKCYLVTETHCELHAVNATSSESLGSDVWFKVGFSVLPRKLFYRSPTLIPQPMIHGVQTAIVVGPAGQDMHTDAYGRIKVKFHWERRSGNIENSSCWVRVSQAWAGSHWGALTIPRIGQEVIVQFLDGNPDRPLVVGSVYNAAHMPPYALPEKMSRSGIRSRSLAIEDGRCYNEIYFDDQPDAEVVGVKAQKDFHLQTQKNKSELIGCDYQLVVQGDVLQYFQHDYHLKVNGDHRAQFSGSYSLVLAENWQSQVGSKVIFEAGQEIYLCAGVKTILEAGSQLTLRVAGSFIHIDSQGITLTAPNIRWQGGICGHGSDMHLQLPRVPTVDWSLIKIPAASHQKQSIKEMPVKNFLAQREALRRARGNATPFIQKCRG